jgi:hypothetical protein
MKCRSSANYRLFVWLVVDGWCWWLVCSEKKVLLLGG